jgi:two-component system CheB/CheR fusion protein
VPERDKTYDELLAENAQLRARLDEPEATMEAIRLGEVDAFVVQAAAGETIYTLGMADLLRHLHLVNDTLPLFASYVDREHRFRFVNRRYEAWYGLPPEQILGRSMADLMGEAAFAAVLPHVDAVLGGSQVSFEQWWEDPASGSFCVQGTFVPHVLGDEVQGFVSFVEDVSERKRAEVALRLLADAGRLLSESLQREDVLAEAARLVVPTLADECAIDLVQPDGRRQRVATARAGLDAVPLGGVQRATAEGGPTVLTVPLVAQGRLLGEWTFAYAESARRYKPEDEAVAQELARRVAAALENSRLYRELGAANQAKDHFLATLSHELRTPLTPVLALASRLEARGGLPEDVQAAMATIRRNVELEARLIDDLLDLTRISRGKLELHRRTADLRTVIGQALETCDEEAMAARRVETHLTTADHAVVGDPARLAQVFWNLLSNALKFTPAGGTVRLSSRVEGVEPRWLVVEVADSGVGIAAEALPHIFEAFDQGEAGTTRRFGGLGLGLAISRAIVEMHGGQLAAASPGLDGGATFTVRLPLAVGAPAQQQQTQLLHLPSSPSSPAKALRILLVEDHVDTAEAIADLLRAIGHQVTVAGSVAAGIAAGDGATFDLVVSDLGLPDGDGYQLMRHLTARNPVIGIALSGYGMDEDVAKSLDAGFTLHLTKPVSLEALRAAIEGLAGAEGPAGEPERPAS